MLHSDIFRALADPTRCAIFERLAQGEMSVGALKAGLAVSQPAVSQHLAALRDAGLVTERREGRFAYYRVEPRGLAPLLAWLERYRAFWPARIDKLKDVLREMQR
jgi:DNA-binding transcriptional ArsR family regulator